MIYHHTKFGGKIIICSENTVETVIFWLYKPRDLKREDSNQFKKKKMKTVWPMVMDIHTKFGYKRLSGSEDRQADMVIPVYPLLTWLKVCVRVCVCVCVRVCVCVNKKLIFFFITVSVKSSRHDLAHVI